MGSHQDAMNRFGVDKKELERIETRENSIDEKQSQHRHSSHSSHASIVSEDTDPLSPLELAISPGVQVFEEVARVRTVTSVGTAASRFPEYEVSFEENDPDNPRYWPLWYRSCIIFAISFASWVIVLYSTSYTASTPGLVDEFGSSTTIVTLGVTTYMFGLATGSLLVAPASELYGRRPVYIVCLIGFAAMVIPTCLATSLAEILVVRFFAALFGSAMIANSPGTVVDISTEETRALFMSLYSTAPLNGPVLGPVIGGYVFQYLGWRWDNWLVLILAGLGIVFMFLTKETYAPIILQKRAAKKRKETDDERWWCRYDQKLSKVALMKVYLLRPLEFFIKEPILWLFNVWISLIYGILYLCFVAYPIVFSQHRGWGPGTSGLAFIGIGIGCTFAIVTEPLWRRIINSHPKDPATGRAPPEATARVMIIGAILAPIGQLVFSWTCLPTTIHWAIPIAFGIPFGAGNTLSFIYGSNYLAGAYGIYAASALAGNTVTRSLFGGTLPLAGPSMYAKLTPQWAGTLLGLLEAAMIPIPIIFYRYGEKIRSKSTIIRQMREDQEKNERRVARAQRHRERVEAEENSDAPTLMKEVDGNSTDLEKGIPRPAASVTRAD
ncbi:MFS general substrate transporter [Daldinia caldariorum]|uniref:MFS general substrate transporter n=1 Tax=Daldinia caldariorum TaxID=326644 RepID=UPI002008C2EA|nr:MFS general substrate transporter [Daldinia caldariorum]KAI1464817.1 MFS general substrate transporter [Daldinia caldariorum]